MIPSLVGDGIMQAKIKQAAFTYNTENELCYLSFVTREARPYTTQSSISIGVHEIERNIRKRDGPTSVPLLGSLISLDV